MACYAARVRAWLAIALIAWGCGDDDAGDGGAGDAALCGIGPGSVEVGEGGARWSPLPESGGELEIVRGAQGGIHVLVGFTAREMDLNLSAHYELNDATMGGATVGTPTDLELRPTLFSPDGSGGSVRNPDLVILDNEMPSFERFVGRTLSLSVRVVSRDGSHACDARTVTLINEIP